MAGGERAASGQKKPAPRGAGEADGGGYFAVTDTGMVISVGPNPFR